MAGSHEFAGDKEGPAWLRREGSQVDLISEDETVAQVYVSWLVSSHTLLTLNK